MAGPLTVSSIEREALSGPDAIAVDDPPPPTRLGKYLLVRRIARGGMGDVHLAKLSGELGFEKLLVVKTIRHELAADPRYVELFAREAKTAVGLSHPNITPIYELGRADDGTLYTAMGWVDGPSLAEWIERLRGDRGSGPQLGAALLITRELLDGLAHAHSRTQGRPPVVHRDITPRNVLIDRSGRVQIIDFGIAKPVDSAEVRGVAGSVGYMAPEQARGEAVDPRADVFSVGCVLYELLTLERAFPSEGVWMSVDLDHVPVELRAVLRRALAIDPADRFADAREFLRELAPLHAELAPTYGSSDLAGALAERFDGADWAPIDRTTPGATPATFATPVHTTAFATRASAVEADPKPVRTSPRTRVVAVLVVAVGLAGLVALLASLDAPPRVELADAPPPKLTADSVATTPSDSVRRIPPSDRVDPEPDRPAATGTVLTVTPTTAEVSLDGVRVAGPPHQLPAASISRALEISAPGFRSMKQTLEPDAPAAMLVELEALGEGMLTVVAPSVAWAEVWLDGEKLGTTPLTALPTVEGPHKLEVRCTAEVCGEARVLARKTVQIRDGRTSKVSAGD